MKKVHNKKEVTISESEYIEFLKLKEENTVIKEENLVVKEQNIELTQTIEQLMEQIRLARQKRFGKSSELSTDELVGQISFLFNEAEVYENEENLAGETPIVAHTRQKKGNSGSVKDILPKNCPVDVVEHRLSPEELLCKVCGTEMVEIGKDIHRSFKIIPAQVRLQEDWYYTYACKTCEKEAVETPILKIPQEKTIIPGGFASPEAVSHIMTQKFVMGSPLYRQEQELKRQGVQLSRQTMSNWILRSSKDWLSPIYEALHQELLKNQVLHADETTLQVLKEPGKSATSKSYMWLYRTSGDAEKSIVLYEYQPDRKSSRPQEFLDGFSGYLHCDGYAGYHNLHENVRIVGCWAHARRKFDEAVKSLPKDKQKTGSAATGLAYCSKLFHIEKELADFSPEERQKQRLEQALPVVNALFAWAETRSVAPKSALGKALHYLKTQEFYLRKYLEDGRLEISNNRAERSIKPFVIDRKNFLFANTPNGATGSAVMFSLIETAKENGLNPYEYLVYVLKTAPNLDHEKENWVEVLLPWNAPEICRVPA